MYRNNCDNDRHVGLPGNWITKLQLLWRSRSILRKCSVVDRCRYHLLTSSPWSKMRKICRWNFNASFRSLSTPIALFHSPSPFSSPNAATGSGGALQAPPTPRGPGQSPGCKRMLTRRVSKRTTWQHLWASPQHFLWRKMRHSTGLGRL